MKEENTARTGTTNKRTTATTTRTYDPTHKQNERTNDTVRHKQKLTKNVEKKMFN